MFTKGFLLWMWKLNLISQVINLCKIVTEFKSWTISIVWIRINLTQKLFNAGRKIILCKPTLVNVFFLPKYSPYIKFTSLVKIKFFLLDANTNILLLRGWEMWQHSAQSIYGEIEKHYSWWNYNSTSRRREREMAQILGAKLRAWEAKSCYSVLLCVCVTAWKRFVGESANAAQRFHFPIRICHAAFHHGSK